MLLRKRAEELVELMEKTKAELAGSDETISGDVYIGGGETDAVLLLAEAAGELQEKYPLIHYHIYSGDAEIVMEKLDKGLIDFGLLVGPVDVSRYEYMRLPVSDTWGVLMRKDSPLAQKGGHPRRGSVGQAADRFPSDLHQQRYDGLAEAGRGETQYRHDLRFDFQCVPLCPSGHGLCHRS